MTPMIQFFTSVTGLTRATYMMTAKRSVARTTTLTILAVHVMSNSGGNSQVSIESCSKPSLTDSTAPD